MDTAKPFWTLTFELVHRNIATLYFKTETVAETAFRASWFSETSAGFPGTWRIFCNPGDSQLTPACLGLQWNGHTEGFGTLTLELLGRNTAPFYFKTERVGETVLSESWFWAISRLFPESWGIYSSQRDSTVTPDGLGFQWNGQSTTLELLGRNIAPLYLKTERVDETALRAS